MAHEHTLVPIKIKITRGMKNGNFQNIYPDFDKIDIKIREGMNWSHYMDAHGLGMHYDRKSGFGQVDDENPDPKVQYCATLVPQEFAMAAVQLFPALVQLMDEEAWEKFYDERAHGDEPDETLDEQAVKLLLLKKELEDKGLLPQPSQAEISKRARMLDPLDSTPGIRRNHNKRWQHRKGQGKIELHPNFKKKK